ncbi:hypothetical protein NLG97_g3501 [Lecanicillium saksenae]|uniref:Uncharacterized protein n=1 Tax=Lecanicillium saksenae TaxID=468837 RepID=A0ACC1QYH7_9HYPO|nr:hypothetical protein NLG97_g3501 [Lecanicillium saksenae]
MSVPFPNLYNHRKVAEASAKACDICYKMSTSVLITPDSKDFFYVCAVHLKDRYFCTPKIDEEAAKAKRERELDAEKEKLKKEYEEKQRRKKENEEASKKDKDKDDKKKDDKKDDKDDEQDAKKDGKDESEEETKTEEPRVFELKTTFYQQRLQRKRQAEAAKRDRERVSQPEASKCTYTHQYTQIDERRGFGQSSDNKLLFPDVILKDPSNRMPDAPAHVPKFNRLLYEFPTLRYPCCKGASLVGNENAHSPPQTRLEETTNTPPAPAITLHPRSNREVARRPKLHPTLVGLGAREILLAAMDFLISYLFPPVVTMAQAGGNTFSDCEDDPKHFGGETRKP